MLGPIHRSFRSSLLIALAALALLPMSAAPAFAWTSALTTSVEQTGGSYCFSCSSVSVTTGSAINAGDVLVISVQTFRLGSTSCSTQTLISDTKGNTWTKQVTKSEADTVTITMSASTTWIGIQYQEVVGVTTSGMVVSSNSQQAACSVPSLMSYSLASQSFSPGSVLIASYSTDYLNTYAPPVAGSS